MAVIDNLSVCEQSKWFITELLKEEIDYSQVEEISISEDVLLKDFFEWQFKIDIFDFIVIPEKSKNSMLKLFQRNSIGMSQVISTIDDAKANQDLLERMALKGYELLIATCSSIEEMTNFFAKYNYRKIGNACFDSGQDHDLLEGAWNKAALIKAVSLASRMDAKLICCFAHDADPVYLLSRSAD